MKKLVLRILGIVIAIILLLQIPVTMAASTKELENQQEENERKIEENQQKKNEVTAEKNSRRE